MTVKINNRVLNNYYDRYDPNIYDPNNSPTDSSGNKLGLGDKILYCPGTKQRDSYITEILREQIDGTNTQVYCIKLKNNQYRTLAYVECYLVTPDFVALHSKRVFAP